MRKRRVAINRTDLPDRHELLVAPEIVPWEEVGSDGQVYELNVEGGGHAAVARGHVPEHHVVLRQELQSEGGLATHAEQQRLRQQQVHIHSGLSLGGRVGGGAHLWGGSIRGRGRGRGRGREGADSPAPCRS